MIYVLAVAAGLLVFWIVWEMEATSRSLDRTIVALEQSDANLKRVRAKLEGKRVTVVVTEVIE